MADEMYTMGNGHEVERDDYVQALRGAWNVYGALVANGLLPAYNLDGSEKVQLAKFLFITAAVDVIATAMINYDTNGHYVNFAEWERENKPTTYTYPRQNSSPRTVEDEDFPDDDSAHAVAPAEPMPNENDELFQFLEDAFAVQGLPYDIIKHDDRAGEYLKTFSKEEITALHVLLFKKAIDMGYKIIPPEPITPAEKPAKKGKKAKSKKSSKGN